MCRRHGERIVRQMQAWLRLAEGPQEVMPAQLRDISATGLALITPAAPARGTAVYVSCDFFDAVARVVAIRRAGEMHSVHLRFLTLEERA